MAPLGTFTIDKSKISVGGLSSGAFFAVQYHVSHSSYIMGASVMAGGPWYCAEGQESTALTTCMTPEVMPGPNANSLASLTKVSASVGDIDPVEGLANAKVFVYSGMVDSVVARKVVQATVDYYKLFVTGSSGNVTAAFNVLSEHCFPTLDWGESCASLGSPYIGNCKYDGAEASLTTIYGALQPRGTAVAANLLTFDQTQFATGFSLNSFGFVYVPTACANGTTCALHINFHGCQQTTADILNDYPSHVGLNEWAETNNIIVLYPQISKSELFPSNPEGCWDWWGYTDSNYSNKNGAQLKFVEAMITHMIGGSPL